MKKPISFPRRHLLSAACLSIAITASLTALAANAGEASTPPADPALNYHLGVATHFCHKAPWMDTWDAEKLIPMIVDLHVGWIRDEITWSDVEPEKGRYRISENTRKWVDLAHAHGLKIIACFNNNNRNYSNPWDPVAYAKAAAWLAHELAGKIDAIEILNEPFGGYANANNDGQPHPWTGRGPDGSVSPWIARYGLLLNTAADAIKAANPSMTVIGLDGVMPETYRLLELGVSPHVDAIVDHPYSFHFPPEIIPQPDNATYRDRVGFAVADSAGTFASYIHMCLAYSAQHHGPKQIWITESGFSTFREGDPKRETLYAGFSEAAQAAYSQRRFLEGLALAVPVDILYDFLDDSGQAGAGKPGDIFDPEQNFGLLREGAVPKPAYYAVRNVARATTGFTAGNDTPFRVFPFSDRSEDKPRNWDGMQILPALNRIMAYPFTDTQGRAVLAVWSAEHLTDLNVRSADIEFSVDPSRFTATVHDLMTGRVYTPETKIVGGHLMLDRLAVPDHPVLITLEPAAASADQTAPIASATVGDTPDWFSPGTVWKFNPGREFPGADGAFATAATTAGGEAKLTYDFTRGGRYVGALLGRTITPAFTELQLRMKASTSCDLLIRLFDANGEVFQYVRPYDAQSGATDYRIVLSKSTLSYAAGKNGTVDKKIDFPLRGVFIGIQTGKDRAISGDAAFTDLRLIR